MALGAGERRAAALAAGGGLLLAAVALYSGRAALIEAAAVEPFRVEVLAPHRASERWTGRVVPTELAPRVRVRVDGREVSPGEGPGGQVERDSLNLDLAGRPGLRLVEVELERQGGRSEVVADAALVGPFAERWTDAPGCGVAVRVSASAIDRLILPPLRARLLAAARGASLLGPSTALERAELRLYAGSLWFRVALAGEHRISVSGRLSVRVAGPRSLGVRLETLGPVEFSGTMRDQARGLGAGVGALVTGPFAPLGALVGYMLADGYVDRRARQEVEARLTEALAQTSAVPLVPESAPLIAGEPRSRAALAFCGVAIEAAGVAAHLSLRPVKPDPEDSRALAAVRTRLAAVPGPARRELSLPPLRPVEVAADAEIDLSLAAIDALLDAWTASGLLGDLMARAGWVERVDAELAAWTTLGLAGLEVRLPPALDDDGGEGWSLQVAGLRLQLTGLEGQDPGDILLAGRGRVRPHVEGGRIVLAGSVERLRLSCARAGALWPCFGALLELGEVERRLDALLAPGAAGLPAIDARALLRGRTTALREGGLELTGLALSYPAPGLLRVSAQVR